VENATRLGYLLAQQLVAVGERDLDVQPKLAARVRLLATAPTALWWPSRRCVRGPRGWSASRIMRR
jgi:hypothetical protein